MTKPGEPNLPVLAGRGAIQPWIERSALDQLPKRQLLWIGGSLVAGGLAGMTSLWAFQPELALALALGVGASMVNPRKLWAAPFVVATVGLAGLLCVALGVAPVIGAGAVAGAIAAYLLPQRTDGLDIVHGALGTLAGSALGLWVATAVLPASVPAVMAAAMTTAIVGLLGSQGLLPIAIRFDTAPQLPGPREIQRALRIGYRPPVFRALDLYAASHPTAPDRDTRRGLAEVATWVFRLQVTMQALDNELAQIDPDSVQARIDAHRSVPDEADEFTRERRAATAQHLERLLHHRHAIAVERGRTEALVDYALAFLEEARAAQAVARELPGEATPERLSEVLDRLRHNAQEGDVRRKTARELGQMQA